MTILEADCYKNKIVDYYQYSQEHYRIFWNLDESLAMHMGYWNVFTFTLKEALTNLNDVLAETVDVKPSDYILDAGCGVGGSSIYLAEKHGCKVVGITLSDNQVNYANQAALNKKVVPIPNFKKMDFSHTDFESESFDIVWAIESVCHEKEKAEFMKEAFRILKKGGRLILADYFSRKEKVSKENKKLLDDFSDSWGAMFWMTPASFKKNLENSGFSSIEYRNITNNVMPSLEYLFYCGLNHKIPDDKKSEHPIASDIQKRNYQSSGYSYQCFLSDLVEYGIFYGIKI